MCVHTQGSDCEPPSQRIQHRLGSCEGGSASAQPKDESRTLRSWRAQEAHSQGAPSRAYALPGKLKHAIRAEVLVRISLEAGKPQHQRQLSGLLFENKPVCFLFQANEPKEFFLFEMNERMGSH